MEDDLFLSELLDGELEPEERARVLAALRSRPDAHEWLESARRLGELAREIWGERAPVRLEARAADASGVVYDVFARPSAAGSRTTFSLSPRSPRNGSSET